MKHLSCFLVLAAAMTITAVSCDKDETITSSTPSIAVKKSALVVPYEGGVYTVGYTLTNAVDNGVVKVDPSEDWISDFDFSIEDTVSFTVALNPERETRSCELKVRYLSADYSDTLSYKTVTVTQELNNFYDFTATSAWGYYYGLANMYNNEGNVQFRVTLSDTDPGEDGSYSPSGTYYFFDFWSGTVPGESEWVNLPVGEYVFGQAGERNIFSDESHYYVVNAEGDGYDDDYDIVAGSVTVKRSGGITTISADLEDGNGGVHQMTYSGSLSLENVSLVSTLDGDYALGDFSDVACEARYYGDYFRTGTANWVLCIYPETDGTGFTIDLCGPASFTLDSGSIPTGVFSPDPDGGVSGTFLTGGIYSDYLSGTWLVTLDGDGALTSPYAPIVDGSIEVSQSGGAYTLTIDGYDDRGYNVTGSWTGTPELSDYTTSTASLSSVGAGKPGVLKFHRANPVSLK